MDRPDPKDIDAKLAELFNNRMGLRKSLGDAEPDWQLIGVCNVPKPGPVGEPEGLVDDGTSKVEHALAVMRDMAMGMGPARETFIFGRMPAFDDIVGLLFNVPQDVSSSAGFSGHVEPLQLSHPHGWLLP